MTQFFLLSAALTGSPYINWRVEADTVERTGIFATKRECSEQPLLISNIVLWGGGYDGIGPAAITTGDPETYPDTALDSQASWDSLGVWGGPANGNPVGGPLFTGSWYDNSPTDQSAFVSGTIPQYDDMRLSVTVGSDGVEPLCLWGTSTARLQFDVYREGDANMDGVFNSNDLISVFVIGAYEGDSLVGLDAPTRWASGDWNNDKRFDSGDMIAAFGFGNYSAAAVAVPESSSANLVLFLFLCFFLKFRMSV